MADGAVIDVREIPPRNRHTLIFQTFQALPAGGTLMLVNDHDPQPLHYQFMHEHPDMFSWQYVEQGPELWKVRIGRTK